MRFCVNFKVLLTRLTSGVYICVSVALSVWFYCLWNWVYGLSCGPGCVILIV